MKSNPATRGASALTSIALTALALSSFAAVAAADPSSPKPDGKPPEIKDIKAYCIDFNWEGQGRRKSLARPGAWSSANPAGHVAWYKTMGANVIQTFCVSTNGYAWYKNGFVPEQPGLKHDFLPEVVKLGHQGGMKVFGYFTISCNPRWGVEHPDLSYGTPSTYHIPYTDEYLDFLAKSIGDAVRKTGIDGFMMDWLWMPRRTSTQGNWLDCEKKLYQQLMGEPFPGEDKLTEKSPQYTAFSRKALDRCWKTIRKAAKEANPDCLIWLTVNQINHPHVVNSDIYKEADWLMNEAGSMEAIRKIQGMVGQHTRLITCMALWNGQDASTAVPEALAAGVGLYGFTVPKTGDGLIPLDKIFERQVCELTGDDRNIAVLARAYHGMSVDALWKDGKFLEPENPPPFHISLQGRGRGVPDRASISHEKDQASVTITTPYGKGRATLIRNGAQWPASLTIRLQKGKGETATAKTFLFANGKAGFSTTLDGTNTVASGEIEGGLDLGRPWGDKFPLNPASKEPLKVSVNRVADAIEIVVPPEMTKSNPQVLAIEWN
jgi:hypothetical protein